MRVKPTTRELLGELRAALCRVGLEDYGQDIARFEEQQTSPSIPERWAAAQNVERRCHVKCDEDFNLNIDYSGDYPHINP